MTPPADEVLGATSSMGGPDASDVATGRRGPGRPKKNGGQEKRAAIVAAAEKEFADRGYDATSLRAIARRAGVDPSLIHHYFSDKTALFAESLRFPANPADILSVALAGSTDDFGERAVRAVLAVWDDPKVHRRGLVLIRTAGSAAPVGQTLRSFVATEITGRIAASLPAPDALLRASLIVSQSLGLLYARYGVKLSPIADLSSDELAALIGPTIQRYATGDISAVHDVREATRFDGGNAEENNSSHDE